MTDVPRRAPTRRDLRARVANLVIRLAGWKAEGDPPELAKYVIIAAPHTSWWDGPLMVAFGWHWGLEFNWLVKSTAFPAPLKWLLRALGGVLVDRKAPQGLVRQLAGEFAARPSLILSVPPEGTRARRSHWRSGFYRIAMEAKVPVCLGYLDYERRRGGFGPVLQLSGDVGTDMDPICAFYAGVRGRFPDLFTPPRLAEEDGVAPGG